MSSLSTSLKNVPNISKPVQKRIKVIDALRGFALLGIILVHSSQMFQGNGSSNVLDKTIYLAISHLYVFRASSIFAFLFGLSFAMQIASARSKEKPFTGRFVLRLSVLLVIGYLHSLVYPGDILRTYAVLGLVLIVCSNFRNKVVLALSILMYILSFVALFYRDELSLLLHPASITARDYLLLGFMGIPKLIALTVSGRLFTFLSLFLLGLCAGRINIFSDTLGNKLFFNKICIWSGITVILSSICYYIFKLTGVVSANHLDALYFPRIISQVFFYIALIVTLYKFKLFRTMVSCLVPVGQMGLTIYIMQSLLLTKLYGLNPDLVARTGLTTMIGITIVLFIGQILFAYSWMSRYRYGPVEWLWRSLFYFSFQPILRKQIIEKELVAINKQEKKRPDSVLCYHE